jgi:hypothetical protein
MKLKRGNRKHNPKKFTAVPQTENQTVLNYFGNANIELKRAAELPQGSTNMYDRIKKIDKSHEIKDQHEVNSTSFHQKPENIKSNSLRSLGSSILNLIGRKDLRYNEQELDSALLIIKKIMNMSAAEPFNIPVNPTALGIPDYFALIDKPMDFGTICENLEKGHKYVNSEDVFNDVQLIWNNCIKYNKKGDFILELMKRVKSNFNKQWNAAGLYREQHQQITGSSTHVSTPQETTIRNSENLLECHESPATEKLSQQLPPVQAILPLIQAGSPPAEANLSPVQPCFLNKYVQEFEESVVTNKPSQELLPVQAALNKISPQANQPQQPVKVTTPDCGGTQRKTRGPTRCQKLWNTKGRIYIATNNVGQPIGSEVPKLSNFLGTIARDGLMAPLTFINWKSMPESTKDKMWRQVEMKFIIDPKSKSWVMNSLARRWKDWKLKLKADNYTPHSTLEERLADRDPRVQPDQWSILVSYWNLDEVEALWQKRSAINKANRAQQKPNNTTGTKSSIRLSEEEKARLPDGKETSEAKRRRVEKPVNEWPSVSKFIEKATEEINKGTEDDMLNLVLGKNKVSLGTPKLSRSEAENMVSIAKNNVHEMKLKMNSMEKTCAQMAAQMSTMISMMSSIHKPSSSFAPKDVSFDAVANSSDPPQPQVPSSISRPVVSSRQTRASTRAKI